MTGTLSRTVRNSAIGQDWRIKLIGLGAAAATFGVAFAAIVGAYEWQILTVLASGLTAILVAAVADRDKVQLQYRSNRFALTCYVFSAMLVGMVWAGAYANTADVLNVLWYGLVAWGLSIVFFWMPAKKKPGRVPTVTTVPWRS